MDWSRWDTLHNVTSKERNFTPRFRDFSHAEKKKKNTNHNINLGFLIWRRLGLYRRRFIADSRNSSPQFSFLQRKKHLLLKISRLRRLFDEFESFWVVTEIERSSLWFNNNACKAWRQLDDNLWHPVVFYSPTVWYEQLEWSLVSLRLDIRSSSGTWHYSSSCVCFWGRMVFIRSASDLCSSALLWSDSSATYEMQLLHEFVVSRRAAKNPQSWHESRQASQCVSCGQNNAIVNHVCGNKPAHRWTACSRSQEGNNAITVGPHRRFRGN